MSSTDLRHIDTEFEFRMPELRRCPRQAGSKSPGSRISTPSHKTYISYNHNYIKSFIFQRRVTLGSPRLLRLVFPRYSTIFQLLIIPPEIPVVLNGRTTSPSIMSTTEYTTSHSTTDNVPGLVAIRLSAFADDPLTPIMFPEHLKHLTPQDELIAWHEMKTRKRIAQRGYCFKATPVNHPDLVVGYGNWFG